MDQLITGGIHLNHDSSDPTRIRPFTFAQAIAHALRDLPLASTRRVYLSTFKQWEQYAKDHKFNVLDLFHKNVKGFLYSGRLSHNTRLSRKSHLLKLLLAASRYDPRFANHYVQLRELEIQRTARDKAPRRKPRALSAEECRRLLSVWKYDNTHKGIRNYAVICLLLHTALGTTELVALQWEELNWDTQTLTIFRYNENRRHIAPILDPTPNTLNALSRLQCAQRSLLSYGDVANKHILSALSTGKNACFLPGKDSRTSTQTIRTIVAQTAERAGMPELSLRDLNYTSTTMFSKEAAFEAGVQSFLTRQVVNDEWRRT